MGRTLVTPQQQNISIVVPENYVGRQIEVLVYAVDELVEEEKKATPKNAAKFKGVFLKKKVKNLMSTSNRPETNGTEIYD